MIIERRKNSLRNLTAGIWLRLYELVMPFVMRTVMIHFLGLEYAGLNGLFNSVLQVLNMAELGVGSAMVYSMYRPIAEDDSDTICALMALYRRYYRIIGGVVGLLGLGLLPFVPMLIRSGLPRELNVYALYLLYLGTTVLSYWLFAYRNALLLAHQRNDVTSRVRMGVLSVQYVLQILSIVVWKNYYLFLIIMLASQALTNIATAWAARRLYPRFRPAGKLDGGRAGQINRRIADLFAVKLSNMIVSCADSIVISAFLGLTVLAVYQNYFTILTAVTGTISILYNSVLAGIGNSLVVESREKNLADFRKLTFLIGWIAGFCTCCFLCLYQPFMEIWVGREHLMEMGAVVCLCVYFYIYEISRLLDTFKDAAGIWKRDKLRLLVTALTNLGLNLLTVRALGIYGVLLSTVVSLLLIGLPWLVRNLFEDVFGRENRAAYLRQLLVYGAQTAAVCLLTYGICCRIPASGWAGLISRGLVCCLVPNGVYYGLYRKKEEFDYCRTVVKKELGRLRKG